MSRLGELILHKLCDPMPPNTNPWVAGSAEEQLAGFKGKFSCDISPYLGKRILEIGAGNGILAEGLRNEGAGRITVTDYWEKFPHFVEKWVIDKTGLDFARADARSLPFPDSSFETVISEDGFEHFLKPATVLAEVYRVLIDGGVFMVTFGPPWLSPRGGHMMFLHPPPWFQLVFSDKTIFAVRGRYRSDGITCWSEGYSPLSKVTIRQFRHAAKELGFSPCAETIRPVHGLKILVKAPLVREFFCNLYAGIWRK